MKQLLLLFAFLVCATFTSYAQVELVTNGTFEDTLSAPWGAYAASAAGVDYFRVDSQAYEGDYCARIWDHTWGVFLWNDVPSFTDSADYTFSCMYKGDETMKLSLLLGRDLGYDLVVDPDSIVPEDAAVESINELPNSRITWILNVTDDWTPFAYTFRITDWLGVDPESGEPISAVCAFMFENTSYAVDDGPSSYVDNVSIIKEEIEVPDALNIPQQNLATLYPSPALDQLRIAGIDAFESVSIISITGKVVQQFQTSSSNLLDVSSLTPGLYLVRIATYNGNQVFGRFIKQ